MKKKYKIDNIHTKWEFSYALYIEEDEYQILKDKICERCNKEILVDNSAITV